MKDLNKLLEQGAAPKTEMSKEEIQAKLDVLMEMLQMLQTEVGSSVKTGMDELLAPPVVKSALEGDDMEDEDDGDDEGYVESSPDVAKVEVVADNPEDLKKGLETAEEVIPEDEDDSLFAKKKDKKKFF